ncbi:MAG: hypothetical protein HYU99_03115 [Deltaproteobacteria bacterium]|nr:hypothetical protein [Deltaproteobacteria bacterium]
MRPIVAALAAEIVCFAVITIRLRLFPTGKRARMMTFSHLALLPLVPALYYLISPDLCVLPFSMIPMDHWIAVAFSIFLYSAGFFGGILQLYNLADRGFSLRILIDLYENPSGRMSLDEIMTGYSQGRGIDWMYKKRIQGMVSQGLLLLGDGSVSNTEKGKRAAVLFSRLRRWFKFPAVSPAGHA